VRERRHVAVEHWSREDDEACSRREVPLKIGSIREPAG
jgi:hypothetical protein